MQKDIHKLKNKKKERNQKDEKGRSANASSAFDKNEKEHSLIKKF